MKVGFCLSAALLVLLSCSRQQETQAPAPVEVGKVMVCPEVPDSTANQWIAFRRDVELTKLPSAAPARIAADSKYWLWINGQLVVFEGGLKRGPAPEAAYYDSIDLAPYLQLGENKIALLQWYFGKEGFSHKDSGKAQLWFDCPAIGLGTDEKWLCRVHPAYGTALGEDPNFRLAESNLSFDARKDLPSWQTAAPEAFQKAVLEKNTLGTLYPRPIPQWKDFGVREIPFECHPGKDVDTLVARLPHNMQMTPVLRVNDPQGGHRIILETDHVFVGEPCLWADYYTRPGEQVYESLGWLSGMQLIVKVEHGARVTGLSYRETGYDCEQDGRFNCSDPFFNQLWDKGLRTIYVNARDTFFDCPDRERAQWWGDIVTILGECFYTYSPSLHLLVRKGLLELAAWQREDGVLHAPVPAGNYDMELPVQMLAAVGKYGLWTYYMNTGDLETLRAVYPAVKRYLALYELEESGLTAWHDGDWNWGDWGDERDMRLLQTLWYCLALEGASNAAEVLGEVEDMALYRMMRSSIGQAVNRECWNGSAYRHPDYEGETDDRVQALAVVAGVAGPEQYEALYETLRAEQHASPYMEKYVMEALFMMGKGDYALQRVRERYDTMVNHPDYDTLFELWEQGSSSVNHAWSGGPLAVLPTRMLGLVPTEAGWKRFSVSPDPAIFDDCTLSFHTVAGLVAMDFCREGAQIQWEITVPKGTRADVHIPWPYEKATLDRKTLREQDLTLQEGRHQLLLTLPSGKTWKGVNFSNVRIEDHFWSPRLQAHREQTLAVCIDQIEQQTGRIRNFERAAKGEGEHSGIFFDDSDVYKALEGMAYSLQNHPDPVLEAKCDEWIDKIAAAQQEDGYLNTYYTLTGLDRRWKDMDRHEMYCAGHLIEAAVAYFQVTGKRKLLDVSERMVRHMMSLFGPGKRHWVCGHEEIELALVKLYETTGEKAYLDFADWLLSQRGHGFGSYGDERVWNPAYYQDAVPVRQMSEISGHAVRSMYLFCGMADVASYTGDPGYRAALDRVWEDVVQRNMYITGGIGQSGHNEGFTEDYSLPNKTAYCETCASVGMVLWNYRMNQFYGDARYADVMERALFNGALAGISLSGDRFFYVNPLESEGDHHRQRWYGCACCPSQICRFLPSVGNYVYGESDQALWVHLYMGNTAQVHLGGKDVTLTQKTDYPWFGDISLQLAMRGSTEGEIRLRIPGWCHGYSLTVNGETWEAPVEKGYAVVSRKWTGGDQLRLQLEMPVEVVRAHPRVLENQGRRAVRRGPLVYCLEEADNPEDYDALRLSDDAPTEFSYREDKLGGLVEISAYAGDRQMQLIPYYAWDNRQAGKMQVWIPVLETE